MTKKSKYSEPHFFSRDRLKENLKRKTLQSTLVKFGSNATSFLLNMLSTIILARLLMPEEFGLLVMVTAITEFARSFRELGLGSATVQREEVTHGEVSTLFWINFGVGIIIMLIMMILSPILVSFYGEPRLLDITIALSTVFLFGGLTVQHRALLERQMRFGSLGLINIISTTLSICVAVWLAVRDFGVWSLVYRDIVAALTYAVGTWLFCRWIPGLPSQMSKVKSSIQLGMDISGYEIIQYLTRSLDRVLIGRFYGPASLGLYSKGFQLASMPIEQIRIIFWDVGFSPLSSLQEDAGRFRRFYSKMLSAMTIIYMPLVVFLVIQSENIIRLILGEVWLSAAPIFCIVAVGGFFRPVMASFQLVMISSGNSRRCVRWGVINGLCLISAFSVGILWGSIGVAYAYAVASYISLIWSLFYCFKDTPINAILVVKNVYMGLLASCFSGILLIILIGCIGSISIDSFINIVISLVLFFLSYFIILYSYPGGKVVLREFWSYRKEILAKS